MTMTHKMQISRLGRWVPLGVFPRELFILQSTLQVHEVKSRKRDNGMTTVKI
ncbi:formate-dependent phosphoribosylglycinamide formyltransferase (GAR transformylase) [Peptococcaceae bacterium DYL19]|nr:formate-dependent phosphoribosylglycinamide formyltransferase (GAR transformylase) [Phosphitispora fastidiosa]